MRHTRRWFGAVDRVGVQDAALRSVRREEDPTPCSFYEPCSCYEPYSFYENKHLGGGTDMVAVFADLLQEEKPRRDTGGVDHEIPMLPDHGQEVLDDLARCAQPGYPAIGRLKGLAELRGIERALSHSVYGLS